MTGPVPSGSAPPFPHLFSPFRLGAQTLRNRMVMPGITTNFAESDGSVGDRLSDYLAARARGGFGLIVTENIGVHASGRVMPRMVMGHEDRYLPGLARLADAIKREGACAVAQISHAGRQTKSKITGLPLVSPSPIPCPINREMRGVDSRWHSNDGGGLHRRRDTALSRRFRRGRDPRRPRLSRGGVPVALFQQARRPLRRQPRQPYQVPAKRR